MFAAVRRFANFIMTIVGLQFVGGLMRGHVFRVFVLCCERARLHHECCVLVPGAFIMNTKMTFIMSTCVGSMFVCILVSSFMRFSMCFKMVFVTMLGLGGVPVGSFIGLKISMSTGFICQCLQVRSTFFSCNYCSGCHTG